MAVLVKDGLLGGKPSRKIGWGLICNVDKEIISDGTSTKDFIFLRAEDCRVNTYFLGGFGPSR